jgi:hypothetical protein
MISEIAGVDIQTRAALVNRVNEITQAQDNLAQKQFRFV